MMQINRRNDSADEHQPSFWISYSDLLAGILLVFVLLLVVALYNYSDSLRVKRERLEAQKLKLVAFHRLEKELIENLRQELKNETVTVNADTGVLEIESGILFGEGEASLQPQGITRLSRVFDAYFRVVLSEEFLPFIRFVEIEGHTNSNGTYLFNLQLSQARALAVMKALLQRAGDKGKQLQPLVVASGRSFSELVRDDQGREDPIRSRRIVIKFRLKEAELFRDVFNELVEN